MPSFDVIFNILYYSVLPDMRMLSHTHMGRPIVLYKYIFMDFNAMIFTGLCAFLQLRIIVAI